MGLGAARCGSAHDLGAARHVAVDARSGRRAASVRLSTNPGRASNGLPMHHLPALTSAPMPRSSAVVRPSASAPIDDVALLDAQRAHRLGAVGHDAERLAGSEQRFPHRAAVVGRHVDFVGELARVADAKQPRRDRPSAACSAHSRSARNGNAALPTSMSTERGQAPSRECGPASAAAAHCSVTDVDIDIELGPLDLQQASRCCMHLAPRSPSSSSSGSASATSRDVVPSSSTMPSSRSIMP